MNNNKNLRNRFIHLYNPKEEGLGTYDIHYINAYNKTKKITSLKQEKISKREAA